MVQGRSVSLHATVLVGRAKKREFDGCQRPWLGLLSGLLGAFRYRLLDMQYMHVVSSLLELLVLLRGTAAS